MWLSEILQISKGVPESGGHFAREHAAIGDEFGSDLSCFAMQVGPQHGCIPRPENCSIKSQG